MLYNNCTIVGMDQAVKTVKDEFYFKVNFTFNMTLEKKQNGSVSQISKNMANFIKQDFEKYKWLLYFSNIVMIIGLIILILK